MGPGDIGSATAPACPECTDTRTVSTIDRALYCPTCGHTWREDVPRLGRTFVPKADSPPRPLCPQCGTPMTYEDAAREPGQTAGSAMPAVWVDEEFFKHARCRRCGHLDRPVSRRRRAMKADSQAADVSAREKRQPDPTCPTCHSPDTDTLTSPRAMHSDYAAFCCHACGRVWVAAKVSPPAAS